MKVKWLGHASFLVTSSQGTRIITDPYATSDRLVYGNIAESAEIVTVSHEHGDHNNTAAVGGNPQVVRGPGAWNIGGVSVKGVAAYHDGKQGQERGQNTVFTFTVDGVTCCHAGDLGHILSPEQVQALAGVDVLFVPVGGSFTVDAAVASQVVQQLNPRVVIPMHVKNERCLFPIGEVEDFLKGKAQVRRVDGSEVELNAGQLPAATEIVVLKPAL